jgi:hypothetical protein
MPTNRVNTNSHPSINVAYHPTPAKSVNTARNADNLQLKLRMQARNLGLIPGSAPWRAYVLGTLSAIEKRKRQKAEKASRDGVTPGK